MALQGRVKELEQKGLALAVISYDPPFPLLSGDVMRRLLSLALVAALFTIVACQRDPGRDVEPMADPLQSKPAGAGPAAEIIPLEKVRKSQAAAVSQRIATTELTITYSRPVARGRELFGKLVPFDHVWNPGADQATAIAVNADVHVNDQALPRGKYSLWAIPRATAWTVIFNKAADVYHTPYPGETQDACASTCRPNEALTWRR